MTQRHNIRAVDLDDPRGDPLVCDVECANLQADRGVGNSLVIANALANSKSSKSWSIPDGRLWLDRLDTGRLDTGTVLQ